VRIPGPGRSDRLGDVELLHSGKVRDVYADGDDLILVASDRISVYDVVLPTPIPDKGAVLTRLSLWWFEQLADIVPNHVISATDVPEQFAGRAIRCKRLEMLPVECIVRGYLAGQGLTEYVAKGHVAGVELPPGLVEGSRLPEPVFTPTTKAPVGEHDEFITFDEVREEIGKDLADELRELTLRVYSRGAAIAAERGIVVADTKLEFGRDRDGAVVLGDEVLTPDSSRFWDGDAWEQGRLESFDKQYLRNWLLHESGWDRAGGGPPPRVPDEVVAATRERYLDAYSRLTGTAFASG
jgi:phosphoribosylaminoimidazole-succinocarboxamide synthase